MSNHFNIKPEALAVRAMHEFANSGATYQSKNMKTITPITTFVICTATKAVERELSVCVILLVQSLAQVMERV